MTSLLLRCCLRQLVAFILIVLVSLSHSIDLFALSNLRCHFSYYLIVINHKQQQKQQILSWRANALKYNRKVALTI